MRVDGQLVTDANWSQKNGTWSIDGIELNPGINRVIVEAFDQVNGGGSSVYEGSIDIWYNDSSVSNVSSLTGNVVLTAASGPWLIASSMTVPAGSTLTIEAGTSVYFSSGARLTVTVFYVDTRRLPVQFYHYAKGSTYSGAGSTAPYYPAGLQMINNVERELDAICKRAGKERCTLHDLHRSAIINWRGSCQYRLYSNWQDTRTSRRQGNITWPCGPKI